jgi:ferritin
MLKENIAKALCEQVNAEFYSSYLYLSMSAYADRAGFKGIANWLYIQAREEMAHGVHMYQYLLDRGVSPSFSEVKAPPQTFGGVTDIFEKVLAHEEGVTEGINNIAALAEKEGDHAAYQFIGWYLNEQVEEESNAGDLLAKLRLAADHPGALYTLDSALAGRVFTDPFASKA